MARNFGHLSPRYAHIYETTWRQIFVKKRMSKVIKFEIKTFLSLLENLPKSFTIEKAIMSQRELGQIQWKWSQCVAFSSPFRFETTFLVSSCK